MGTENDFFFSSFFFYYFLGDGRGFVLFLHRFGASLQIAVYLIASNCATRLTSNFFNILVYALPARPI
jgi:hypothetical protein